MMMFVMIILVIDTINVIYYDIIIERCDVITYTMNIFRYIDQNILSMNEQKKK